MPTLVLNLEMEKNLQPEAVDRRFEIAHSVVHLQTGSWEENFTFMPHIALQPELFGIRSGFAFRPDTAKPMNELAELLLHGPNSLSPGERELIATYVSSENGCRYCQTIHGAVAAASLDDDRELVEQVKHNFQHAPISEKLKALLTIAGQVQQGGKSVTERAIALARQMGASDREIHDTVLIAAAFCMFNRYVDGLATALPQDENWYHERGKRIATEGYVNASREYLRS